MVWVVLACGGCGPTWFSPSLIRDDQGLVFNDTQLSPALIVADGIPFFEREPIFEAIPDKIGSHAATITTFADGELLTAWYSYGGPHELDGATIYMSRRPAGSEQWEEPKQHIQDAQRRGNPVLFSEQDRVWLFHAVVPGGWSTSRVGMQVSEDRGHTWSEIQSLPDAMGTNVRYPPVRTNEGLLLPAYDDLFSRSLFFRSADGWTWECLGEVSTAPPNIQPSVAQLPDGRLLAVMRNSGGGWLWVMGSDDSGWNWSPPTDSGFANPGSAACILVLASGNLLLVFNDSPAERVPLSVAMSADGGMTWPVRKVIAQGTSTYSYPSVVQAPDGMIHVVYSLGRDRIEHVTFSEAWLTDAQADAP